MNKTLDDVVKLIKPKVNQVSDKFSYNLWRFVSKKKRGFGVYFLKKSFKTGEKMEFNEQNADDLQLYILGKKDGVGNRLRDIMSAAPTEGINVFYFGFGVGYEFQDVTEWFIEKYLKIGRCLFDKNHDGWITGREGRFVNINKNSKRCKWCGKYLKRKIITRKTIIRREVWEVE